MGNVHNFFPLGNGVQVNLLFSKKFNPMDFLSNFQERGKKILKSVIINSLRV